METYLTIEELAEHLKLAVQTIRRWVLNREIPYRKIRKVIRFRLSEIEQWIIRVGSPPGRWMAEHRRGICLRKKKPGMIRIMGKVKQTQGRCLDPANVMIPTRSHRTPAIQLGQVKTTEPPVIRPVPAALALSGRNRPDIWSCPDRPGRL